MSRNRGASRERKTDLFKCSDCGVRAHKNYLNQRLRQMAKDFPDFIGNTARQTIQKLNNGKEVMIACYNCEKGILRRQEVDN